MVVIIYNRKLKTNVRIVIIIMLKVRPRQLQGLSLYLINKVEKDKYSDRKHRKIWWSRWRKSWWLSFCFVWNVLNTKIRTQLFLKILQSIIINCKKIVFGKLDNYRLRFSFFRGHYNCYTPTSIRREMRFFHYFFWHS